MALPLPGQLTLPSGTVVRLRRGGSEREREPGDEPEPGAPLFADALAAFSDGRVTLTKGGSALSVSSLPLRDFHVLRAVLARSGVIADDEAEITCRNCDAPILVRPCGLLEVGPWVDGEIDDPELDSTLPFGAPIEVPPLPLGRVRMARSITFEDRTVEQARPLLARAAQPDLAIDGVLVRALGIVALDDERDPERITRALQRCDDDAFTAVSEAFLDSHYVRRLACIVFCTACRARNDVDAPFVRELAPGEHGPRGVEPGAPFPDYATFAARARAIAEPLLAIPPSDEVELVIDEETPPVDDAGETLLGSYLPIGDPSRPTPAPLVSVYYRTFAAMWNEDGPYDWEDELAETIEHELEHHGHFLRGYDPMDDDERAEIRDEATRVVGRREAGRRELVGFGASVTDFVKRTWPLWVIVLIGLLVALFSQD